MTSRNLTEVFVIMRNNASKNRSHYDDRVSKPNESQMISVLSICFCVSAH